MTASHHSLSSYRIEHRTAGDIRVLDRRVDYFTAVGEVGAWADRLRTHGDGGELLLIDELSGKTMAWHELRPVVPLGTMLPLSPFERTARWQA